MLPTGCFWVLLMFMSFAQQADARARVTGTDLVCLPITLNLRCDAPMAVWQCLHEMNVVTHAPQTHTISLSRTHTFTQTHTCTCTFRPGSRAAKRWIRVNVTTAYRTLETPNNPALTHTPEYFFNISQVSSVQPITKLSRPIIDDPRSV